MPIRTGKATAAQPRAIGAARLSVAGDEAGKTRLVNLRQSGSMKVVLPKTPGAGMDAILVNTAGGITGGDRFDLDLAAQAGATLSITTQAAERAYRAQLGELAHVTTTLDVADGARLNWLPQELILYDHSALSRRLTITLAPNAQLLMVEPVVFGRKAMDEQLNAIAFRDRIKITRGGTPIYIDGADISGDAMQHLAKTATANGAGAMASLVMVAENAAAYLDPIRALLPDTAGASLLAPDILVMRSLAPDSYELRRSLVPILDILTRNTLPTSWRL